MKYGKVFLIIAATIAMFTAAAHMSCIVLGPQCYTVQMAPSQIIESAEEGTLIAPIATTLISTIFVLLALYALSAANIIRRLPLLECGIYTIAILCIVRGILPLQLWMRHPEKVNDFAFYAGLVWLVSGCLYLFGFRHVQKSSIPE